MHEYGLVEGILERVEEEGRSRGATSAKKVYVSVGALAGVEPVLLIRAFETFRARTLCADATLEVRQVAARWACTTCTAPVLPSARLRCGTCGSPARLVEGGELILDRIELELP